MTIRHMLLGLSFALAAGAASAAGDIVQVDGAWARTSVQGQRGSGAFMRLTAREPLTLVGASSPAAGVTEVHEMKLEGDVMRMRAIPALELPAGRPVELRPGGYHLMLLDLKAPLQQGTTVPISLVFRDAKGAERKLDLQVPVSARAPSPAGGMRLLEPESHKHKH
ncbi:copper chaperone PCu(A)C [Ramlibacter tataouinensis]|uniref:Copper chaperone PCu(A)C n=1 Tax=Ramlibacter tataouinensis (strain ATCC BAA-407 / DSM 14655 / LMG 21543 / TTB310) TaxID=365046 RepID=F5Y1H2_RAMTT|nr:copper chaperone PCu(A)C [Ramlibacter tataouinensis]AEG94756.1 Conserved hypothetical protein [Ramlibacter tataouinensis TTB310]